MQVASDLDVGLLLKLQTKVKVLERERELLRKKIEDLEEEGPVKPKSQGITNDSAFESLKVRFSKPIFQLYRRLTTIAQQLYMQTLIKICKIAA